MTRDSQRLNANSLENALTFKNLPLQTSKMRMEPTIQIGIHALAINLIA